MYDYDEIIFQAQAKIAEEKKTRKVNEKAQRNAMPDLSAETFTSTELDELYKPLRQW